MPSPPAVLDNATVLAYAVLDDGVEYTGEVTTTVGGKLLGPAPALAICQNNDEVEVLLFQCNERWQVLAAGYYSTVERAIESAERQYRGSTSKWHRVA